MDLLAGEETLSVPPSTTREFLRSTLLLAPMPVSVRLPLTVRSVPLSKSDDEVTESELPLSTVSSVALIAETHDV